MKVVKVYSNKQCTQSHRQGGSYGEWSATYNFKVEGAVLGDHNKIKHSGFDWSSDNHEVFPVPDETEVGDDIYAVYIVYNSGDSFGRSTGNGEVVFATVNPVDARTVANAIEKDNNKREYTISVVLADGSSVTINNPAAGYFERLTSVEIAFLQLRKPD